MHLSRKHKALLFLAIFGALLGFLVPRAIRSQIPATYGTTFSWKYAGSFGYRWEDAYTTTLDELKPVTVRIPVYWDDIEPQQGTFDFSRVDWQIDEAAKRGVNITLAVGRKLPRWPECHVPAWAKGMDQNTGRAQVIAMLNEVVTRYKDRPNLVAWQVENEPFFPFGECPSVDIPLLANETKTIRKLDSVHPIIMTESGEMSPWILTSLFSDRVGISMYHTVWNPRVGYFQWPIPPEFYLWHAQKIRTLTPHIFVSELQAEPWFYRPIDLTSFPEQMALFPASGISQGALFAKQAGFREISFWGVEWWYWMKLQGHPEYWEAAKKVFGEGVK